MPSITRALAGDLLHFDIGEQVDHALASGAGERSGRTARTLVKNGRLRIILVVLGPGGMLAEHRAAGPISIQPVSGSIELGVQDEVRVLHPGEVVTLGDGIPHMVRSDEGGAFLLTVAGIEPAILEAK